MVTVTVIHCNGKHYFNQLLKAKNQMAAVIIFNEVFGFVSWSLGQHAQPKVGSKFCTLQTKFITVMRPQLWIYSLGSLAFRKLCKQMNTEIDAESKHKKLLIVRQLLLHAVCILFYFERKSRFVRRCGL